MMLPTLATALVLLFEYPRAYTPAPSHFLITATQAGLTDTLRVVRGTPDACAPWQGSGPETICATWPGCPGEGPMTFRLQAVWGDVHGAPTGEIVCQFTALAPCECLAPTPPAVSPALPPERATPLVGVPASLPTILPVASVPLPTSAPLWTMPPVPPAT